MEREQVAARTAVGATLLAAVFWGTSFSVNDIGLQHVGPATFVVFRFLLAGVLTLAAAALLRRLDASILAHGWFWGLVVANALAFLLQYLGQTFTTPARTALFVNSSAFAVALLERVIYKLRLGPWRIGAILLGVAGAALLIVGDDPSRLRGGRVVGDLLALTAGLSWSVFFVVNRTALTRHDPVNVTAWVFMGTALVLVPVLPVDAAPLVVPREALWAVLYAGVVTTAVAYGLWAFGLRRLRASASAVLLLVEILVASLVSLALGREQFGAVEVAGAVLLVAAVMGMSLIVERDAGVHPA